MKKHDDSVVLFWTLLGIYVMLTVMIGYAVTH